MNQLIENLRRCRRLAVMGGTFDPIHYGHLAAAEAVRHAFKPDRVLFVPAGRPPHKDPAQITDGEHRYAMTLLATADHPCFEVSRMELERPGLSYTIDTIRTLREICGKSTEIYFITGADALDQIRTWRDAEVLLTLCRFVAVTRPGYADERLNASDAGLFYKLDMPAVAISSTGIRERVALEQPIRYLLPPAVEDYIRRNALYLPANQPIKGFNMEEIKRVLSERLSPARYAHTLGVVDEAVKLAKVYGVDTDKAYAAGLLHDCAKEYEPAKKRALCRVYGIELDEVTDKQIDLTHSVLSAETARHEYGVSSPDILQAIRYHTTGHKNMTLLDKIVMLADFIEATRENYPGLKKMRALAYTDINGALRTGIKQTIHFNEQKGRLVHPDSREALRCLRND